VLPEVLIVGDTTRRDTLAGRVRALGYEAAVCGPDAVAGRVSANPPPAVVVVCIADTDTPALMATLRSTGAGAAIPVTLCGSFGGSIRDLADVLDLGADHFLEEPVTDDLLVSALEGLAGPPPRPREATSDAVEPPEDPDEGDAGNQTFDSWPVRTEVIDEPAPVPPSSRTRSISDHKPLPPPDPVIGQLHRTLGMLGERPRAPDATGEVEGDDLDLAGFGIDAMPELELEPGVVDPGESHDRLEVGEVNVFGSGTAPFGPALGRRQIGPRETTVLLEEPGPLIERRPAPKASRRAGETDAKSATSEPDRPRRAVPLPIERRGSLAAVEVPRLLWRLHRGQFDGAVALVRGRVEKRLWMDAGQIVFARSNLGQDRLVDGLLRRGLLTRAQYEAARRLAAKEPRRAGQLLVEAGLLKPAELPRVLREHLSHIVDSTFPWSDGSWELAPGERCEEAVRLETPTALVLAAGVRHRMEPAQLTALLGGLEQYPRLRADAVERMGGVAMLADHLVMSPSEEGLLARLDGKLSLRRLLEGAGAGVDAPEVDEAELLALVYVLHVFEIVDVVGEAQPEPASDHDPVALDGQRITERLRLAREADYFALLGLDRAATRADVRRAWSELVRTFADDALEPRTRAELAAQLAELRSALEEAKDILCDDALRSAYLAHLEDPS
jgi:hypothetical protein